VRRITFLFKLFLVKKLTSLIELCLLSFWLYLRKNESHGSVYNDSFKNQCIRMKCTFMYFSKFEKLYAQTHIYVECIISSDIKTERVDYEVWRRSSGWRQYVCTHVFVHCQTLSPAGATQVYGEGGGKCIVNRPIKTTYHTRANVAKAEGSFTVYSRSHSNACLPSNR